MIHRHEHVASFIYLRLSSIHGSRCCTIWIQVVKLAFEYLSDEVEVGFSETPEPPKNRRRPRSPAFRPPIMAGASDATTETDFRYDKLRPHEIFWRDSFSFLSNHGYQLRPRFRPGWVPSWTGTDRAPVANTIDYRIINFRRW